MQKKGGAEEVPSVADKRRRIGTAGRARAPFGALNNKGEANAANEAASAEGSECSTVEFTKEEVEALLNEKMKKGNPFDNKVTLISQWWYSI